LNHKIDSKKIVITGNPRYDELFNRKIISNNKNVLITLSGIASTAWSTFFSIPLILKYEKMFREVLLSLGKYEKNVTIKLHPTQDAIIDVQGIVNESLPNAQIFKNANTYDLISQSDVIISPPSSVITEALILDKPVFLFKILSNDSGIPYEKYNSVLATESINEIDGKIKQILFDSEIRNELKKGRKKFLEYALEYQGNSSQQIFKLIKNMMKKE
jgi:CDP-glycerol glycerophosphotransferase (TagB/SpsB family)